MSCFTRMNVKARLGEADIGSCDHTMVSCHLSQYHLLLSLLHTGSWPLGSRHGTAGHCANYSLLRMKLGWRE